jgi:hypothetical protein
MCDDCGLFVEPLEMARGWNSLSSINKSATANSIMFSELLGLGINPLMVKKAYDTVSQISMLKNSVLKGRRKKSLLFASIFAECKGDPDDLREKLKLSKSECNRAIELYETHVQSIQYDWCMLLRAKLKVLHLEDLYNDIYNNMLQHRVKMKISQQLVSCTIYCCNLLNRKYDEQTICKVFGISKYKKWSCKNARKIKHGRVCNLPSKIN